LKFTKSMPQLDSYIMLELPCSILIFFLISLLLNLKKIIIIFSSLRTKVLKVFVDKNLVSKLWKELKRWIKNYFLRKIIWIQIYLLEQIRKINLDKNMHDSLYIKLKLKKEEMLLKEEKLAKKKKKK